jgi:threonine-phosphate decarboxylase
VVEAICAAAHQICPYPNPYCTELVEALAVREQVKAEQIICGNGAADVIFQYCLALHPVHALVLAPTFSEYEQGLRAVGCAVEEFCLERREGFRVTEAILDRITEQTDVVFICNPNNPTGVLTEKACLQAVARRCQETGTRLFLDECFNDFLDYPEQYTMRGELEEYPNLFILKAFTKLYGMAGVRLGYGLCSDLAFLQKMGEVSQTWNVSTLAQAAGVAALSCTEFVEQTKQLIVRERSFLKEKLTELGIQVYPGTANYLMLRSEVPLYERLLEKKILSRRCANYHGLDEQDYRIAVKTHEENLALLDALREVIKE